MEVRDMPDKADAVLIQPIGSTEQHGPHLPLLVDSTIGSAVLTGALERLDHSVPALVLPPLYYGKSNEHLDFAGTISLEAGTLLDVLMDTAASIHRAGFRRLALLNAHGGNRQIVEIAARDIHVRHPEMWVFPFFIWGTPARSGLDLHAGDDETSLMLAIMPEAVRTDAAVTEHPPAALMEGFPDGGIPFAWSSRDLTASGVVGDARAASAAKGRQILESLAARLAQEIRAIHAFRPG
ncbi:MAG: creatininase family protein [bacterium]|nr:creatininase family protein [bacterium]